MDGLSNLLPLYLANDEGQLTLNQFAHACRVHQSFARLDTADNANEIHHVLATVNSKLNEPDTR